MKPVIFLAKTIILIFGIIMLFSGCDHHLKWERIGSESLLFLSLAVNSNDYLFGVNAYGEVFQSTDDGATWKRVGNEPSFLSSRENPTIVVISPDDEVLVHSSPGWLYRLGDDGKSWNILNEVRMKGRFSVSPDNYFYVVDGNNVFRSTDGGKTWEMADFKFKDITGEAVVLSLFMKQSSLAFSPGGQIFIGTYGSGLFESKDKGATWIQLKGGWKTTDINSIAVNSTGSLYLCTNEGVFRSADSGTSWTNIGLSEYRVLAVAVSPNGKIFASTESESGPTGIWKTLEQN